MDQQTAPAILLRVMDHIQVSELEDSVLQSLITPSPRSEMFAHEFQELTLQPNLHLPPLNERKNGQPDPSTSPSSAITRHSVLQLKLQQRRTREQLVDQGIMPPLKSPAAFHEQRKSLERARTEDYLKHKIRSRPERSELVRMHILEETLAEPSLQATQMKLKRARLADDLNEKIAQRPGPMELVEKNILPVDSSLKEAIKVGQVHYPKTLDTFSFDDDSSDALSPEQPGSQESQSSAPSPGEIKVSESSSSSSSPVPNAIIQYHPQPMPDFLKPAPLPDQQGIRSVSCTLSTSTGGSAKPTPTLIKQSQPKSANEKNRSKKNKDLKPRVKQLKYHQYVPPDKKHETIELPMDTNYSRLLQQQQLFLQLQILSQQQQHYNYPAILPAPPKSTDENQAPNSITASTTLANCTPTLSSPYVTLHNNIACRKLGTLPSNLDDMKVAELKLELKLRGLPVSGTKMDLIERLKSYQDLSNAAVGAAVITASNASRNQTTVAFPLAAISSAVNTTEANITTASNNLQFYENAASLSPTSPALSEQSNVSNDDSNLTDMFTELVTMVSPSQLTIHASSVNEDGIGVSRATHNSTPQGANLVSVDIDTTEKDRKLQEKERQIVDLKRKLEQEQKLVEELKTQLEIEKRCQHQQSATVNQKHFNTPVKEENTLPNCPISRQPTASPSQPLGAPTITNIVTCSQAEMQRNALLVKQERPLVTAEQQNAVSQFYVSQPRQTATPAVAQAQPHAILTTQTGTQLLLPLAIQTQNTNFCSNSKNLHVGNVKLQSHSQAQVQNPIAVPTSTALQPSGTQKPHQPQDSVPQRTLTQNPHIIEVFTSTSTTNAFPNHIQTAATLQPCFLTTSTGNVHQSRISNVNTPLNGPNCTLKSGPSTSPPHSQQQLVIQHSVFSNPVSKTKDPPRYEEAVKQTRNLKHQEVFNAHSQQMDDLFDILIESGEISPIVKEESLPATKMRAVIANIASLPVNSALSRPPARVQMAPPPLPLESTNDLTIGSENQLEAFLDGTLSSGANIPQMPVSQDSSDTLPLMEDLHNDLLNTANMLEQQHSAMDTCDMHFSADNSCLNLDIPDTNLDGMDWLDLTMPVSSTGLTPIHSAAPGVFSTDFLDGHDLQLHWE
ncbi:myocardin-related transcription factor B isoform X2 [Scyliorhinus canicula]|uniref:myocardin-related transcription factor B isoform X2 n=1 Tax=Scyliorhinus canicula TaxID=7830 RepID=UPI0018F6F6EB|nr:myocardin-related transcription factor B isoform X2 [Scyliorhinus canicula]